jgi:hypothetical protein
MMRTERPTEKNMPNAERKGGSLRAAGLAKRLLLGSININ